MWACLTLLPIFPEFRELVKQVPFSLFTSIMSNWRQVNLILGFCLSRSAKELLLLKCRLWLSENLDLGNLKVIDRQSYELTYYHGAQRYKVIFPRKRGPRKITSVSTQEEENITEKIFEAMGPCGNFHGVPTTPHLLGFPKGFKVSYRTGEIVYVLGDTSIDF